MFQYVILPCDEALDSQTGIRGNGKAIVIVISMKLKFLGAKELVKKYCGKGWSIWNCVYWDCDNGIYVPPWGNLTDVWVEGCYQCLETLLLSQYILQDPRADIGGEGKSSRHFFPPV